MMATVLTVGVMVPLAVSASASAAADVSPPTLISSSVSKKTFDFADGPATFTVTVKVSDPSGVETPVVTASSLSTTQGAGFGSMRLVAGTTFNGTWQSTISIPTNAATGQWEILLYPLDDMLGNSSFFTTLTTIDVLAPKPPDTSAPRLVSSAITRTSFNLSQGPANFTITATISDPSGVETPTVVASSTSTTQSAGFGSMQLISGTTKNGTWQRTISIPTTAAPGGWEVRLYPLEDTLGNRASFVTLATISLTNRPVLTAGTPSISGSVTVGQPVTAQTGSWRAGTQFSYRWFADGVLLSGYSTKTITPTGATVGKRLTVLVTGSLSGYESASKSSAPSSAVMKGTLTASTPVISGTAKVGLLLTATAGRWTTGTTLTYQWSADGKPISGATKAAFVPGGSYAGQRISVQVTGILNGYATRAAASSPTMAVAKGTLVSPVPTINGTPKAGVSLTSRTGTWTSGTVLSYQWLANGKAIAGANKTWFTPTATQRGQKVTLQVTGKLTGYTSVSRVSAATAAVAR